MCGVFYVDDDTAREIEKIVRKVDAQLKEKYKAKDVRPTETATIIMADKEGLTAQKQRWGFPGFGTQKVIINARAETALEKKMFRENVLRRRIVIPAAGFYEWNAQKEKVTFTARKGQPMFFAGFYGYFEGEDRFVILTTGANESMKDVHDRMPLILEPYEIEPWLNDDKNLEGLLGKVPDFITRKQEYEQQKLSL